MKARARLRALLAWLTAASLLGVQLPAHAAWLDTGRVLDAERGRATLAGQLQRAEVRDRLAALGVDPLQAERRVAALSDEEAAELARRLDELPAGGDIVGAAVFVFLVLLITDIAGLTDIFPFVKKPNER